MFSSAHKYWTHFYFHLKEWAIFCHLVFFSHLYCVPFEWWISAFYCHSSALIQCYWFFPINIFSYNEIYMSLADCRSFNSLFRLFYFYSTLFFLFFSNKFYINCRVSVGGIKKNVKKQNTIPFAIVL